MNATLWLVVLLPVVALLALFVGYFGSRSVTARTLGDAATRATRLLDDAKRLADQARADADTKLREAETKIRAAELEAKELVLRVRAELDQESRTRQREIQDVERRVVQQEEQLSRRLDQLDRRETEFQNRDRGLSDRERTLAEKEARLGSAVEEQRRKLEAIAGLTLEEAKRQVLAQAEVDARREAQLLGMRLEEEARETAHAKAKEVLATTIQRLAPDYTVETAVAIVDLPSDDMKGRIIGREGRNIRALEGFTGVDLIVERAAWYEPARNRLEMFDGNVYLRFVVAKPHVVHAATFALSHQHAGAEFRMTYGQGVPASASAGEGFVQEGVQTASVAPGSRHVGVVFTPRAGSWWIMLTSITKDFLWRFYWGDVVALA